MGILARKIIDAIQNLMLDRLFVALYPLWYVAGAWVMSRGQGGAVLMSLLAVAVGLVGAGWLLGAVANRRRRVQPALTGSALEKAQTDPANGFYAWSELPAGGLNPPPFLRQLIMCLGRPSPLGRWSILITLPLFVGAIVVVGAFAYGAEADLFKFSPWPVGPMWRDSVQLAASALLALLLLRRWATDQRIRLFAP